MEKRYKVMFNVSRGIIVVSLLLYVLQRFHVLTMSDTLVRIVGVLTLFALFMTGYSYAKLR